ncbi:transmembrane protein 199 [Microplitis mediator]|uniref:transmembrane protein 199 n=1 Tax=Microplitis mediator TaxID=375433 RepID=UPI00255354C7|nr:transmembrane protein 199 [Microplitis mediator]
MPVEQIEDPFIKIKATLPLIKFVRKNVNIKEAPERIRSLKKSSNKSDNYLLKVDDIKWLNNYLIEYRKKSDSKVYLHELLDGTNIDLPQPKVTPRNPVLEARIKKLTAQQNNRDYEAMTKEVDPIKKRHPEDTIAFQMKEINRQLIAILQFVTTVIAAFAFGFIGIELIVGNLDFGFRLLLGIICGLIVALADIYFLAKKLNEDYVEVTKPMPIYTKLHKE